MGQLLSIVRVLYVNSQMVSIERVWERYALRDFAIHIHVLAFWASAHAPFQKRHSDNILADVLRIGTVRDFFFVHVPSQVFFHIVSGAKVHPRLSADALSDRRPDVFGLASYALHEGDASCVLLHIQHLLTLIDIVSVVSLDEVTTSYVWFC